MRNSFLSLTICSFYWGLFCPISLAGLIVLNPTRDSSIYSENNTANGTGSLYVGRTGEIEKPSAVRRSLVYFDVSSIPAGSTINSVSLQLTVAISANDPGGAQDLTPDLLSLHRLSKNWGEGTSRGGGRTGGAAGTNDTTWNSAVFGSVAWTTAGGDFASQPSATITLTRPLPNGDINSQYLFENEIGLIEDIQNWVNNGSSNFGWMMKYDDEDTLQKARGFWSRESTVPGNRPLLTIEFTAVPEPSSYLLFSAIAIMASSWRFRYRRVV